MARTGINICWPIPLVYYFGLKYGGRLGEGQSDSPYLIYTLYLGRKFYTMQT